MSKKYRVKREKNPKYNLSFAVNGVSSKIKIAKREKKKFKTVIKFKTLDDLVMFIKETLRMKHNVELNSGMAEENQEEKILDK